MSSRCITREILANGARALILATCALVPGAAAQQTSASVLQRYDFRKSAAAQSALAPALTEISGLAVSADGRVFAHDDERAIISQVDPCRGTIEASFSLGRPPVKGDFEGIAVVGDRFFLVTSNGHLFEAREGKGGAAMPFTKVNTGFGKLCEIEGLAYEPSDRSLLMGCKTPLDSSVAGRVSILRWSLARNAPASPARISVPLADVARQTAMRTFHPSSVERDDATGHYVILAGREHALLELTATGAIVATRNLHRQLHRQPEGLTFLGDSVLVVSDEAAGAHATLTCYRHVK